MPTPKFFITHSWKDIEFTRRLCNDLSAHGLDGFFDAYSIKPGDLISKEISDGLERCDIYVPILSHAALKSPWCEEEIHAAITLSKLPGRRGRPRIISILVEDCQDAMPILLRSRLYIAFDGRYDEAFNELLTKGFGISLPSISPTLPPEIISPHSKIATPPQPKIEIPARSFVHSKTGKEMILIPAGEFVMGSSAGLDNEKPPHKVYLDAFYISRYPVINAEYKKFIDDTRSPTPKHWRDRKIPEDKENHPVVRVSWINTVEYCEWAGVRLPTEAEWDKAASWDEMKKEKRVYPWGNEFDASKCNTSESRIGATMPVGTYSPQGDSSYGIADMAGNVWEWCADWHNVNYYQNSPLQNPKGSDSGQTRVLRGGSWDSDLNFARCTNRNSEVPYTREDIFGFRVAMSLPHS